MDYPDPTETHFVRCLKCQKILQCSRYDTSALLEHIRTDHPEIEIVDSGFLNVPGGQGNFPNQKGGGSVGGGTSEKLSIKSERVNFDPSVFNDDQMQQTAGNDARVIYTRRYKMNGANGANCAKKHSLYRTSIEKWRPAKGCIYCPKCGCKKPPLIRTHSERYSNNCCGAACILGCWPFCFLPCIFPGQNKEYLHCANCKNFLGLYDRDNNCIRPNKEFVEFVESVQQETTNTAEI